ncbi:phosphatase PAP2 family protein [Novosphingobium subterraneum]|uniref:PA-phosphatase-like phosphoesterase n=1 Tax=Novosphingobium subterraneum TaxID=48936 RepID=A0A0B8ZKH7_9SPHN|nr:phosphatase PAP2 family protein [Novosphingobium subterraneum]KHS46812.1 PA-phosphatase-like phosphoesterase [Novosphingobium subterraneum]
MVQAAPERHLPQRARSWRISPRHALIASALCWIGFVLVASLVLSGHGSEIDSSGLLFWRRGADLVPAGPQWLLEAVRDLTALGGVLLRNLILIGVLAALLFLRLKREAVLLTATVMGGWLVNSLVKIAVGRPRPMIVPHLTEAGGQSFPSGHSFNSAVIYIAIALAFAAMSPRRSIRWTLIISAIALSIAIAISRVWLGVHFPTDVAAGWLGGAGWAFLASALLHKPAKAVAEQADDMLETLTPGA